jgi:hypothetical protein
VAIKAMEKLCKVYLDKVPKAIILGSDIYEKMDVYINLLYGFYWELFTAEILKTIPSSPKSIIIPILAEKSPSTMLYLLGECLSNVNKELGTTIDRSVLNKNHKALYDAKLASHNITPLAWLEIWNKIFLDGISSEKYKSFGELDKYLTVIKKRIIFVVDGLQEIFYDVNDYKNGREGIKSLCQDMMNQISIFHNIGLIVFINDEIAQASIKENYVQFEMQYNQFSL